MTDLTTEARADLVTALEEMSATKCKADHKTMGAKGKKTCPACGAKLGTSGVEEADVAELRESMLHALETFDPHKHPRGRGGKFIDVLNKLAHDHRGTPDGRRFGAAKHSYERGIGGPSRVAPLRQLGPEASAQMIHMLTPLGLVTGRSTPSTHTEASKLRPGSHTIAKATLPDHGPKGGQSSALKPLNLTVGPFQKVKVGQSGTREIHADVSKRRFTFDPVLLDRMQPKADLKPGDTVRVTKLHGAPKPGTMGQYHVADEKGNLLGMVSGNSLKPLSQSDAGRSLGKASPGVASLDIAKPDTWNDRWNDQTMLRPGSNASRHVQDAADAILDGGKSGTGSAHIPGTGGASDTLAPEVLKAKNVNDLAEMVERDWGPKVNFGARPYLDAMRGMRSIDSTFGLDSGRTVVAYFLSNATQWRGPVAKAVKKELKRRLDAKS